MHFYNTAPKVYLDIMYQQISDILPGKLYCTNPWLSVCFLSILPSRYFTKNTLIIQKLSLVQCVFYKFLQICTPKLDCGLTPLFEITIFNE